MKDSKTPVNSKRPPQAVDFEKIIIGSCLIDNTSISIVVEIFKSEINVFYKDEHKFIYMAMLDLYRKSEPIDLMTVSQKLKENKKLEAIGGDYYLIQLTNSISSTGHLEYHCRILQQYFVQRQAMKTGLELYEKSFDSDVDTFEILDESYTKLDDISDWLYTKKPNSFKENVNALFQKMNSSEKGVPSSITNLQNKLNGYQKSDLIIFAGRPGMGKTAFITSEALFMAKENYSVGIFSLEMSAKQLTARLISNYTEINSTAILNSQTNDFENRRLLEMKEDFSKLPIFIHDQGAMTPMELKIQAKKWVRENKVRIIFIDYIQLMRSNQKYGNREQEVANISQSLKALAKELDIPIFALSQLSRAVETRGGTKRPMLSDLRDSGSIEQDADMVMFIYRPEYYGIEQWDDDSNSTCSNQAEINIAKYRSGRTGFTRISANLEYMRFSDLEDDSTPY